MAHSQSTLGRKFRDGDKTGTASNVKIHETDDGGTVLVGYGHAVYAYRSPSGHITAYMGWTNRSNTRRQSGSISTKQQYGQLGLRSDVYVDEHIEGEDTDAAPKRHRFTPPKLA